MTSAYAELAADPIPPAPAAAAVAVVPAQPSTPAPPAATPGPLFISGDPSALPGYLLISDEENSRVIEVDGRGQITWEFPAPGYKGPIPFQNGDDAFYAPDGRSITTNQEYEHTVQTIDIASRTVTWYYGTPNRAGSAPGQLNTPDDAFLLPDGRLTVADIKNCRVLVIAPDRKESQLGHTGVCRHDPAHGYLSSPNGDAPDPSYQHLVVTEINGSWVDVYSLPKLEYEYSFHSPAAYPSDAEMQPDGTFILTDYSPMGAVYRVDRTGKVLWKYDRDLDHPSIALGLPNGYVCISDDAGDRVLIVDPATDAIKWQYGVKNQPGSAPGRLAESDGLDFSAGGRSEPGTAAGSRVDPPAS